MTVNRWLFSGVIVGALGLSLWLTAATIYVLYNNELINLTQSYQLEAQRAYEDRIATLRRQIDDINTKRFLDQQAVESRMRVIIATQQELSEHNERFSALIDFADKHKISLRDDEEIKTTGALSPIRPTPLLGSFSALRGSRSNQKIDLTGDDVGAVERSLASLRQDQQKLLARMQNGLIDRYETLAMVPKSLGIDVAAAPRAHVGDRAVGGPYIPANSLFANASAADSFLDSLEGSFKALANLERQVDHLPVRRPLPASHTVTSRFGNRPDPFLGRPAFHGGIDFKATLGDRIRATASGVVAFAGRNGGYGLMVEVDHGDGLSTRYAHMSTIAVSEGQPIKAGSIVGRAGSTGRSTGPHLHYETRQHGEAINPVRYLRAGRHLQGG